MSDHETPDAENKKIFDINMAIFNDISEINRRSIRLDFICQHLLEDKNERDIEKSRIEHEESLKKIQERRDKNIADAQKEAMDNYSRQMNVTAGIIYAGIFLLFNQIPEHEKDAYFLMGSLFLLISVVLFGVSMLLFNLISSIEYFSIFRDYTNITSEELEKIASKIIKDAAHRSHIHNRCQLIILIASAAFAIISASICLYKYIDMTFLEKLFKIEPFAQSLIL